MGASSRLVSILAPLGSLAVVGAGLIPYCQLRVIVVLLENERQAEVRLSWVMWVGLVGASVLGLALIVRPPLRLTPLGQRSMLTAAGAFAAAVVLIGWGNSRLMAAFQGLATAELVTGKMVLEMVELSRLPLWIGYLCLVIGATSVGLARWTVPAQTGETAVAWRSPRFLAIISSLLLGLATLWTAISVASFEAQIYDGGEIQPAELASSVSGMLLSVYLSLIGLAGFSAVCATTARRCEVA